MPIWEYDGAMPRAAVTADVFNAIAEPKRRQIIAALARGDQFAVGALVHALRLPQPAVSKHLAVLLAVGLVAVRQQGRERFYSLKASELKRVHDWTGQFERFWTRQIDRIQQRAERAARQQHLARSKHDRHTD